jgi:hypothetical protein
MEWETVIGLEVHAQLATHKWGQVLQNHIILPRR